MFPFKVSDVDTSKNMHTFSNLCTDVFLALRQNLATDYLAIYEANFEIFFLKSVEEHK